MKHAGPLEIEIKYRIPALEPMAASLAAAGFEQVHAQAPEVSVLWDRAGALREEGCALRLRRYGALALLTWKGPRVEDPLLKIRPELETAVEDPAALEGILAALGYGPVFTMAKSRSLWRRSALEACLDEAPFGCFLELEGDRDAIHAAAQDLGMDEAQVEPRSYPALFQEAGLGR